MPANAPIPALLERPCPFITFYSFKGGVGRSMAVINVASIIASRGFRVLVIDMDLEAPGISYLANRASSAEGGAQPGFIDYLSDAVERGPESDLWSEPAAISVGHYCARYELPEDPHLNKAASLHIMPAGRLDRDYPALLEHLNLRELYSAGEGLALITAFKQAIQESMLFDYVFIDSRTGFSDESGICTRDLADYLMVVSGLNKQNVEGTAQFLAALKKATGGERQFEVILSPVPNGEDALVDQREAAAQVAFEAAWGAPVRLELQIPYHPQLALTEEPHIFRRHRGYLFEAYHRIERRVMEMIGDTSERFIDAAITAMKAGQWSSTMPLLNSAKSLSDHPDWITPFALALGSLEPLPTSADSPPVYSFVIASVNPQLRGYLADIVGSRAVALVRERKDMDAAEALFKRAIDADPSRAHNLGNYANFLRTVRKDMDAAEALYKRAIAAEPSHANNLGNYAGFLMTVRKDMDAAEALYKRAIAAEPSHANHLGNYANFLMTVRKDMDAAEALFKRAIAAEPSHAHHLGNYANFCLTSGRLDEGLALLDRALAAADRDTPEAVELECQMYLYCCGAPERRNDALARLKHLVTTARLDTGAWDFAGVILQAQKMGHPEAACLPALAEVLSGRAELASLASWEAWRAAPIK